MKESDRSKEVKLDRLRQDTSGWNPTIDLRKLKLIVYRKKKKWMKSEDRSSEIDIDRIKKEKVSETKS
jgi:hypothetical protein